MAVLVLAVLILAMSGHSSATWCVCRSDVSDAALQKTLDYACGAGADCTPILQNGPCFQPNTLKGHCSYAVNSYFQKKGQAQGSCEFSSTATIAASDPSPGGTCAFPASASSAGTGTTPTTTTPSTTTPSTTTPSTTTPSTTLPSTTTPSTTTPTGVLGGGIGTGLGPTSYTDTSGGGFILQKTILSSLLLTILFSGSVFVWG